jgi:hypothetical protein
MANYRHLQRTGDSAWSCSRHVDITKTAFLQRIIRTVQAIEERDMSEPSEPVIELTEDDLKGAELHPQARGDDDEESMEEQ